MPRLLTPLLLLLLLFACDRRDEPVEITTGAEQRDPSGAPYAEHRIAGLRVVETIVGGSAPFDAELPLVVSLHGRGDRVHIPAEDYAYLDEPVRLLLPEAPQAYGEGFTWSPVSVTENRTEVLAAALESNANRIARILAWARAARRVRGEPIVTGFSQGGMLTFTLAARHGALVGEAIPVAGWLPPTLLPGRDDDARPAVHAVHGVDDPVVRIGPTRRSVRRLRQLGFAASLVELQGVRHVMTPELKAAMRAHLLAAVARTAVAD